MRTLIVLALVLGGCGRSHDEPKALALAVQQCTAKDLGCPRPIIYVSNLDASIAYYRDRLGFRFNWTYGEPPDFASVSRGDTEIFMCQKCQGHPGSWMWVGAADVDKLYAELKKRGAKILAAPEDKPWGSREMHVADPDGNVLRFASRTKR